ncbi:hypothetical protein CA265_10500 [Sphingobacteriaceae bacterium GW460-11-11-14-LB5]|nr:hypothetical protein CA265_10500 [Sphingobacteriaceae bacterium GW460-11-11-14-LB5]
MLLTLNSSTNLTSINLIGTKIPNEALLLIIFWYACLLHRFLRDKVERRAKPKLQKTGTCFPNP